MNYQNASDILPDSLVKEIRKHFSGGLLWIPVNKSVISGRQKTLRERDELIVRLYRKNVPMREIAGIARLTEERVRQVIKKSSSPNSI